MIISSAHETTPSSSSAAAYVATVSSRDAVFTATPLSSDRQGSTSLDQLVQEQEQRMNYRHSLYYSRDAHASSAYFEERTIQLEMENKKLITRITELTRQCALSSATEHEVQRLRQKIHNYKKAQERRDEEYRRDVSDLEKAALLVTERDKKNEKKLLEAYEREEDYKRRLALAETTDAINRERIVSLTEDLHRLSQTVNIHMVDRSELNILEERLKSEMTPNREHSRIRESFESLQRSIETKYVPSEEYEEVMRRLESAMVDSKVCTLSVCLFSCNVYMDEVRINRTVKDTLLYNL